MVVEGAVLITGAAGFIGFHLAKALLAEGVQVIGVDNLNDYYEVSLKEARLAELAPFETFTFHRLNIADQAALFPLFEQASIATVVNLAAQAGVRYSLDNPEAYVESNLVGFANILEACRRFEVGHLVFASSSSVYGANTRMPFRESDNVDHPVSLYAATKKSNELMAHSYAHLYGLPTTGLRFFTVYGPWGRPDMAYFKFSRMIMAGEPIPVFNHGKLQRDFTYIDDIVEGVRLVLQKPPLGNAEWQGDAPDPASSRAPYRIYNIGHHQPVALLDFIATLESALGQKAKLTMLPMQAGDVHATYASIDPLMKDFGYRPHTDLAEGLGQFVQWFQGYYGHSPSQKGFKG